VPNTLLWQDNATRQVAIVFPGVGYTCHMPLLYYPSRALLGLGVDVLWVEHNYIKQPDFRMLSAAEQNRRLLEDASAAYRTALTQRTYGEVTLLGKSLGTRAMAQLFASDAAVAGCRDVWLTPVLRDTTVREQLGCRRSPLVVIGTADSYYDAAYLAGLRATSPGKVMIEEDADHNMEVEGDLDRCLSIIERITRGIKDFVSSS
jgi:predicted alpha/beta-hydrolase family hydrolase